MYDRQRQTVPVGHGPKANKGVRGTQETLESISRLYRVNAPPSADWSITIWLLWVLGSVFKPVIGAFYPRLAVIRDRTSGKTTIAEIFVEKCGLAKYAATPHFMTPYRANKSLSNTNLPVIIDELQRLSRDGQLISNRSSPFGATERE